MTAPIGLYLLLGVLLIASTLALIGKLRERRAYRAYLREQDEE